MYLIPEVKKVKKCNKFKVSGYTFSFAKNVDERVIKLASKLQKGRTVVSISVKESNKQEYKMNLSSKAIKVIASSQAMAFYAVQTLKQILKFGYCDFSEIYDSPDFENRGFYLDITRGRIPTLETLKELVDNLAYYKINMLQLYVEHTFPFKEYDGIYQRTGFISPEEIVELDKYCIENFVEFVPSLSCFGHLYELLSSEKYKHLCELVDFKDRAINWCERMGHHTIDPSNPESFQVIKSLIDQYSPLFTSNKFNICCDETFDLGRGRNAGKDKARLYVDFVRKIIDHVKSKGKTPMMWGDIITAHAELIDDIGEGVLFLSWGYGANHGPEGINKVAEAGKTQYVCPGISNWSSLIEQPQISVPNITKMTKYGYDAGAVGVLNTCWGDYGHISSIYTCMYGAIFGAAKSWNANYEYKYFDNSMDKLYYGYRGASKLMKKVAGAYGTRCPWYELVCGYSNNLFNNDAMRVWAPTEPDELVNAFNTLDEVIPYLSAFTWENEKARENILCVAQGQQLFAAMLMASKTGEKLGMIEKDVFNWLKEFSRLYLLESKKGEVEDVVKVIYYLGNKFLK